MSETKIKVTEAQWRAVTRAQIAGRKIADLIRDARRQVEWFEDELNRGTVPTDNGAHLARTGAELSEQQGRLFAVNEVGYALFDEAATWEGLVDGSLSYTLV